MDKRLIQDFAKSYSIETTVREAKRVERFADAVPRGTWIYIAHIPGTDLQETVDLATRLRKEGMEPVPHIVGRRLETMEILDNFLAQLTGQAGVEQVLAVAGDIPAPVGQIESALQVLQSGLLEKHGIRRLGVAGHPEGHRQVNDSVLKDALRQKNEYAKKTGIYVYVVTQFTFSANPIIAWEAKTAEIGELPYMVGLPGLASPTSLLKFALDCGVGASLEAFAKRAGKFTKLLTVSTPDDIVVDLVKYKSTNPSTHLAGIHFFPFGGFKRTAAWANKIVEGQFELNSDGTGLIVP
jgi:methylenetetrahydrofolate reductase (NADPH)